MVVVVVVVAAAIKYGFLSIHIYKRESNRGTFVCLKQYCTLQHKQQSNVTSYSLLPSFTAGDTNFHAVRQVFWAILF